jgi:hypothetical protein
MGCEVCVGRCLGEAMTLVRDERIGIWTYGCWSGTGCELSLLGFVYISWRNIIEIEF